MTKSTVLSALLGALFVAGLAIAPAYAQATRTWVSGVGDDANPCSRTAPCKTWAGAISKTATAGEIDALDPGGFGALTITKAITLDGGGGQVASVLTAGTPGITINAAGAVVILRNLRFNGLLNTPTPGTTGISVVAAAEVVIEKCDIFGFNTAGIGVTPSASVGVKVQETTINNNAAGLLVAPTAGTVTMSIDSTRVDSNTGGGMKVAGTTGVTVNVSVSNSSFSLNTGNGINAVSGGGTVDVDIIRTAMGENGVAGVQSNQAAGGTAIVTVGDSMLSYNGTGAWSIVGSASLQTFKNNQVTGPMGSTPTQINFQ
jgi:hypothetical protein